MRRVRFLSWYRVLPLVLTFSLGGCANLYSYAPAPLMRRVYPLYLESAIASASQRYGVDPFLVCAVIDSESGWDEDAQSHRGAVGLMQLMPDTVDWAVENMGIENFSYANIEDPDVNIDIGCWVLNFLGEQFNDNPELMAAAYNAGSGNVTKWLGDTKYSADGEYLDYIPYKETNNYVRKILRNYEIYQRIYK